MTNEFKEVLRFAENKKEAVVFQSGQTYFVETWLNGKFNNMKKIESDLETAAFMAESFVQSGPNLLVE
jgi:hypothetical protein